MSPLVLTDKKIKALKPEATRKKYFDGDGLYLEVSPAGGNWWRLKYYLGGKDRRISLGVYPEVSLKEAREKAVTLRNKARQGIDPAARGAIQAPMGMLEHMAKGGDRLEREPLASVHKPKRWWEIWK